MDNQYISLKEARSYFIGRPSLRTIKRWCVRGIFVRATQQRVVLPSRREGGRRYIHIDDIEKFRRLINAQ